MKAEELARRAFKYIYGRIVEDMDKDVIAAWTAAIREAEQQARREALEEAARIVEKEALTEASAVTCGYAYNNAIGDSVYAIRALIEREGGE